MTNRLQIVFQNFGVYLIWIGVAIMAAFTAFQLHATVLYVGILVVENPVLRPTGWNTGTVNALSRFTWLILGIIWLALVIFSESYLMDGVKGHTLRRRATRLVILVAAVYGLNYLALVLL
jgi:hypothetical protein